MTDFLDEKRKEIQARLKELKPLVEEYHRLEAAERALAGVGGRQPAAAAAPRRARSASGVATAAAAGPRARAPARCRRSSWSAPAPASRSPSSPRR